MVVKGTVTVKEEDGAEREKPFSYECNALLLAANTGDTSVGMVMCEAGDNAPERMMQALSALCDDVVNGFVVKMGMPLSMVKAALGEVMKEALRPHAEAEIKEVLRQVIANLGNDEEPESPSDACPTDAKDPGEAVCLEQTPFVESPGSEYTGYPASPTCNDPDGGAGK